jgi:hypothetical protein
MREPRIVAVRVSRCIIQPMHRSASASVEGAGAHCASAKTRVDFSAEALRTLRSLMRLPLMGQNCSSRRKVIQKWASCNQRAKRSGLSFAPRDGGLNLTSHFQLRDRVVPAPSASANNARTRSCGRTRSRNAAHFPSLKRRGISKETLVAITRHAHSAHSTHQSDAAGSGSPRPSAHAASQHRVTITSDERNRIIAGLAFFHGMAQSAESDPWRQWRAAEAQIDAVLDTHEQDGVL